MAPPPRPTDAPQTAMPGRGGGGGGYGGASSGSRNILDQILATQADNSFLQSGQDYASRVMQGHTVNPLMNRAASAAEGLGENAALDRFISSGEGGFNRQSNSYLDQFITGLMPADTGQGGSPTDGGASEGGESPIGPGHSSSAMVVSTPRPTAQQQGIAAALAPRGTPTGGGSQGTGMYANPLFDNEAQQVLSGYYLTPEGGNPYSSGLVDEIERRQRGLYDAERGRLDARSSGAGQYGSSLYQNQAGNNFDAFLQNTGAQTNQLLGGIYESERDRMMQALGLVSNRDQAQWGDQTQRYGIGSAAGTAGRALAAQVSEGQANRDLERYMFDTGTTLQGINLYQQGENSGLGLLAGAIGQQGASQAQGASLLGGLGTSFGNQQLQTLGMVPGLDAQRYYGLQLAGGMQQGIDQQNAQAAAASQADAWRRYQADQQSAMLQWRTQNDYAQRAWEYEQGRPDDLLNNYLNQIGGIGGMGGTITGVQQGPQQYSPSVLSGAIQGGIGGLLSGVGAFT